MKVELRFFSDKIKRFIMVFFSYASKLASPTWSEKTYWRLGGPKVRNLFSHARAAGSGSRFQGRRSKKIHGEMFQVFDLTDPYIFCLARNLAA